MWQLGLSSCGDLSEGYVECTSEFAYWDAEAFIHQFPFLFDYSNSLSWQLPPPGEKNAGSSSI